MEGDDRQFSFLDNLPEDDRNFLDFSTLPRTQKQARKIGSRYYMSGPCPKGHNYPRYASDGRCVLCSKESSAKLREGQYTKRMPKIAHRSKARELAARAGSHTYVPEKPCPKGHMLRWTTSTNCVDCNKISLERRKEKTRHGRISNLYGLTADQHEAMFALQERRCAVCDDEFDSRFKMHVDHCHRTNKVRGLLCSRCNQAIGLLRESQEIVSRVAEYLNAHAS